MEEINEQEGDESHAVELGEVNAFAWLWYFRTRWYRLDLGRGVAHWFGPAGEGEERRAPAQSERPAEMRATNCSARSGTGPSVSGSKPGLTRWIVCRPARSVSRSLATVRSARLVRQAAFRAADQLFRRLAGQQLETDQVNCRGPIANQPDHLGRAPAVHHQDSSSELILPTSGSGSKSATAMARIATSIGCALETCLQGSRHSPRRCRLRAERACSRSRGGRQRSRRRCRDDPARRRDRPHRGRIGAIARAGAAPRGRGRARPSPLGPGNASVIAAANRPEETLVKSRTSSIGAIVPPPVTTTFIAGRSSCSGRCEAAARLR